MLATTDSYNGWCNVLGALLQLATHSWIAVLLFMWIGESYEIHGSRLMKVHTYSPRSSTIMLCILLANSEGIHPTSVMY